MINESTGVDFLAFGRRFVMSKSRLHILTIAFLLGQLAVPAQAQSTQYTVTDLGAFTARAINNSSSVVGSMGKVAVLFRDGVLTDISPSLGPSVDTIAEARGINDLDQVVGGVTICDLVGDICINGRNRAFFFDKGTTTVLGTLGGRDSQAFGINNAGQITGWSDTAGSAPGVNGDPHAFIFKEGLFQDIGAADGLRSTIAFSINTGGQVTGRGSSSSASTSGAFIFSSGLFLFFESRGTGHDISNSGQIVGLLSGNDDGSGRAFLFTGGVVQDLGTLTPQHTFSNALAINNSGKVVGYSNPSFFSLEGERAFVFSGGVMQDLNDLIPSNSGWVLNRATDINDVGQIVGNGQLNGQNRAFMLTPTEPMLLTELNSNKAIVLESVIFLRDPFRLTTPHLLSSDTRTRLTILARNMEIIVGETVPPPPTVQAEDAQHRLITLPVEFVGKVPGAGWLTQIVVRLPDELANAGEVQVRVSFRDRTSNTATFAITATAP